MTSDEVRTLFTDLGVLQTGHFRLSSGLHSDTYLQCACALAHPAVALRLGRAVAELVRAAGVRPDVVASPALGGILAGFVVAEALGTAFVFAERGADRVFALRRGQVFEPGRRVLVVEDVITTGRSALEVAQLAGAAGAEVVGIASLVDRSVGLPVSERPEPKPISLLAVAAHVWDPSDCPRCAAGAPIDTPGSRHSGSVATA